MSEANGNYGWAAQPRDVSVLLEGRKNNKAPQPQHVSSIQLPDTALAKSVLEYARKELSTETFNHSMRVYYYGKAIQMQQFPDWNFTDETYLLVCLLHDIGTTDKNISATHMSFEFYGGMLALDLLSKTLHAPMKQAESVAEAVMRHQDIGETGKITTVGQLIQLATIFDNMGGHEDLVHMDTVKDVVGHYPRNKWSSCFAATIRKEIGLKPWAHTTALGEDDFPNGVENNKLMEPYD
ncbi:MAG: hypothetical protein LQ346_008287 [Caloplaca aetnensis]|nr:MAG: hypothetical protein LQ346_008287 [Caloplaca aetnensis]